MGFHETFNTRAMLAADRAFGVSVKLRRGQFKTAAFTAPWQSVDYEVIDAEGFTTKITSRDYVIPADKVVINGLTVEPRDGDVLEEVNGNFEVMKIPGRPGVELLPGGYRWLVHTKKVN